MSVEVKWNMYSADVIEKAIALHTAPGRNNWKYLEMTEKQKVFLAKHGMPEELVDKIDRGAAALLISDIIERAKEVASLAFPNIHDDMSPYGDPYDYGYGTGMGCDW
jgi:hypothetical protein